VISYWADKSSTTNVWTPAAGLATRGTACATGSGRICSALADSGGPVGAGPYGPVSASTDAASDKVTAWSIVLAPTS
jgi:hypothetical protein